MNWHPNGPEDAQPGTPLSEAIDAFLSRRGYGDLSLLARVLAVWEDVVGPAVATHVTPVAINDDALIVEVDRAAWATELTFLSATVLAGLRARLGEPVATAIKPRVRPRRGVE